MKIYTVEKFKENGATLIPYCRINGVLQPVAWGALGGSQAAFLAASEKIVLFQGPRGGTGKSAALIADALQDVELVGAQYRAIMIRKTYPELEDAKRMAAQMIPLIYPDATYNETSSTWTFPNGATIAFRPFEDMSAWNRFLGRNVSWVGVDEIATYESPEPMLNLLSLLRVGPRARFRAATNCWGSGRDWILNMFHLTPARAPMIGPLVTGDDLPARRVITGSLLENIPLLYTQKDYLETLKASTKENEAKRRSWIYGEWATPPNMFFGEVDWKAVTVPMFDPPSPGRIFIALDPGHSDPTACVFVWPSNGEDVEFQDGTRMPTVRGDLFVVEEYTSESKPGVGPKPPIFPKDIAERLHAIVDRRGWNQRILSVHGRNPADTQIFNAAIVSNAPSVADAYSQHGINFEPADKARVPGWLEMLKRFAAAKIPEHGIREEPGLFICANCTHVLTSLPNLMRKENDPDDITDKPQQNDHLADAIRYACRRERVPVLRVRRWRL